MRIPEQRKIPAFWAKIERRGDDECWPWTAALNSYGYGQFRLGGASSGQAVSHRIAYELEVGPIPDGLVIDHLCRNRACCNPRHMEPVVPKVNTMRGIGRSALNAQKTECPAGHSLSGDNLLVSSGRRLCRTCRAEKRRAAYAADPEPFRRRSREHQRRVRQERRQG